MVEHDEHASPPLPSPTPAYNRHPTLPVKHPSPAPEEKLIEALPADDVLVYLFFFQAEDGIRDLTVTGVQTCALPILGDATGSSNAADLADRPAPRISFNYHGQWDATQDAAGLYRSWRGDIGQDMAPDSPRTYLIDVTGVVENGELGLGWTYSADVHDEATIQRVAGDAIEALREIVEYCTRPDAGGRTPSDFPLAPLDQRQVDQIVGTGRNVEDIYPLTDRKSTRLNSSHSQISYAVFC